MVVDMVTALGLDPTHHVATDSRLAVFVQHVFEPVGDHYQTRHTTGVI